VARSVKPTQNPTDAGSLFIFIATASDPYLWKIIETAALPEQNELRD
jgi:hypothetical protein